MASVDATKFVTAVFAPGAVNADTAFDLPAHYPEIDQVIGGATYKLAEAAPNTFAIQALTGVVYASTIADNTISNSDGNTLIVGHALDASDLLVVSYRAK